MRTYSWTFQKMTEEDVLRELREGEDDLEYYTLFNVDKNADAEEIRRAYHRLCKIYHPDRYQDEQKQKTATEFFSRIQEAYKVLNDSRLRSIYDKRGKKGLDNDLAIVERTLLPVELLGEYEKLRELWEERTYIQNSQPSGNFKMELDATRLVDGMDDTSEDQPLISFNKCVFDQSVNATITKSDLGQVTGFASFQKINPLFQVDLASMKSPRFHYRGGIQFSLRHLLSSQNWVKFSTLVCENPMCGVVIYRVLGQGTNATVNSGVGIENGLIVYTANASITSRLTDSTVGVIVLNNLGHDASFKVIHQHSSTTSITGEASVGMEESYLKGIVRYQPLPKYVLKAGVKAGTAGLDVMYGIEHEVAKMTSVGASVLLSPRDGVVLKLKLCRAFMNFSIRVCISDFVGAAAIVYATSIPLALYGCIKALALAPLIKQEWLEEIKEKKREKTKEVVEKRSRAESAVELMQETLERIMNTEQAKHGLLIVEAWYGKLFDQQSDGDQSEPKVIDVRVPLQCLVIDSKLILHDTSKANIPGFYDPCIGEKKHLRVRYEFRGTPHEVTVENSEPLLIPRASHRVVNIGD